jgi:hypothetical protein
MFGRAQRAIAAACLLAACSSGTPKPDAIPASTTTVAFEPSRSNGKVVLDNLEIPTGGGFAVIYTDENGVPGQRKTTSPFLEAGTQPDLELDVPGEEPVWLLIHRDVDQNQALEYPGPDTPISDTNTGALVARLIGDKVALTTPTSIQSVQEPS